MKRTEAEQDIEQVAGLIYQQIVIDRDLTLTQVENWNREGWSYEVRYDSHEYPHDADHTRVEGEVLSSTDLYTAWLDAQIMATEDAPQPAR